MILHSRDCNFFHILCNHQCVIIHRRNEGEKIWGPFLKYFFWDECCNDWMLECQFDLIFGRPLSLSLSLSLSFLHLKISVLVIDFLTEIILNNTRIENIEFSSMWSSVLDEEFCFLEMGHSRTPFLHLRHSLTNHQCDQMRPFIGLQATFWSFWQKLICPNLPHS